MKKLNQCTILIIINIEIINLSFVNILNKIENNSDTAIIETLPSKRNLGKSGYDLQFKKNIRPELLIVMPVYNEEKNIHNVIVEWFLEIEKHTQDFIFLIIDDGSTDFTLDMICESTLDIDDRFKILVRANKGHGTSCFEGYQMAYMNEIPFVFQIDSDGQCDPSYFGQFWQNRLDYDYISGNRVIRDDGLSRVFISKVLMLYLLIFKKTYCKDANVPYRLMKTDYLNRYISLIYEKVDLANIALSLFIFQNKNLKKKNINIRFKNRSSGKAVISSFKSFFLKAVELHKQIGKIEKVNKNLLTSFIEAFNKKNNKFQQNIPAQYNSITN